MIECYYWLMVANDSYCFSRRGLFMSVCYKKLWKILIDKDMKKKDLVEAAGISTYTINKLI